MGSDAVTRRTGCGLARLALFAALVLGSGADGQEELRPRGRAALAAASAQKSPGTPLLSRSGPYGDPLLLAPPLAALAAGPFDWNAAAATASVIGPAPEGGGRRRLPVAETGGGAASATSAPDDDDDDDVPVRPGTLGSSPTKVPGRWGGDKRTTVVAPHLSPDLEFAVGGRTTLGLFGEVGRPEDEKKNPITALRQREVGAGLTLQYKFGQ